MSIALWILIVLAVAVVAFVVGARVERGKTKGRTRKSPVWSPPIPAPRPAGGQDQRANRPISVGETLRDYAKTGQQRHVVRTLTTSLPDWPVRSLLIDVVNELMELERGVEVARTVGVPDDVTSRLSKNAQATADVLWQRVDRIAAAARISGQSIPSGTGPTTPAQRARRAR